MLRDLAMQAGFVSGAANADILAYYAAHVSIIGMRLEAQSSLAA
jgi:hypothetical protein